MTHKYLAPRAPSFKIRLEINEKDVPIRFENGVFTTEDDEVAKVLDETIVTSSSLGLHIRKADMQEAEALVAIHQKAAAAQVLKGATHSGALDKLKAGAIPASGNAAAESAPNNPEELEKMQLAMASENSETAAEDALILTEKKVVPIIDADQPDLTAKSPAKISF